MARHRPPSKRSKYYMPKQTYYTVIHHCTRYPLWIAELAADPDANRAIDYSKTRVQSSNEYDPTSELAMQRAEIRHKKEQMEEVALAVAGDLSSWLLLGVGHDLPYYALKQKGIPCSRDSYSLIRRKFYFEMSKII